MQRIIPRKTKIKLEFVRGVTGFDLILMVLLAAVAIILFSSNFEHSIWIGLVWTILSISIFLKVADDERFYMTIAYLFRFMAQKKKFSVKNEKNKKDTIQEMIPFNKLIEERFIDFGTYLGMVVEVKPVLFGLLNEYTQDNVIESFANALRRLNIDQTCSVIKINRAMVLDNYIYNENKKYETLLEMQYEGHVSEKEVDSRAPVFEERVSFMENMNRREKVYKDHFYIVVYGKDKELLENTVNGVVSNLASSLAPMSSKKLYGQELYVFLKANYGKEFDEREIEGLPMSQHMDWAKPKKLKFKSAKYVIDDKNTYRTFLITDYPLNVWNAWGSHFFLLDRTKVVMKFGLLPKHTSERNIDKAIMDMESKLGRVGRSSMQIDLQTHVQTLRDLLHSLKNNNQQLFEVNTYITCEDSARRDVKAMLRQSGFKFSEMFARQVDAFISSNISQRDNIQNTKRGIPTSTLAAVFPFISSALQDENGIYIGDNEYPVFVDFFQRDNVRVNSNMMVIGKSGSGKSYFAKTLLTNLAADNSKIFICDPEKEYDKMTQNFGGKYIDVGSSLQGILNPFHIITALEDDDEEPEEEDDGFFKEKKKKVKIEKVDDSYSQHLQFLEQFFRTILDGISSDAFEVLNTLIVDTYAEKGITEETYLGDKEPKDYPIFDDLYQLTLKRIDKCRNDKIKDEFRLRNLLAVETYIKKFASGGRNSKLWNGPTSIETNENLVCFNFQSLIANNNQLLTNAQMLLVFRYLNNEIINNKDFNSRYHPDGKNTRKIVIVVDEAHIFINPKYPIALEFMAQMAKRIRKYAGMQIVLTQNITDFVGSEEIQRQSTAVINACQYSTIFALAPNDINDLVELYKKSGGVNEEEQNAIVTAGRGQAFFISGPSNRTMVQIVAQDYVREVMGEK